MTENSKTSYTPRQIAQAVGVSEASIKRWCDKGILDSERTGGGHRRIGLDSVVIFLRENQFELIRPEIIGLPSTTGKGQWTLKRAQRIFLQALVTGDEEKLCSTGINLYLAGFSLEMIFDQVIAVSFEKLGKKWQHGDVEVYQERRGVEITQKLLYQMHTLIRQPELDAPKAIGGALSGDLYSLSGQMVQLCLRQWGWQAGFIGCNLPGETLKKAIYDLKPQLFWLNVNVIESEEAFYSDYELLADAAEDYGIALVVGGRALTPKVRKNITYSAFCDHLEHLKSFIKTFMTK